MGKTSAERQAAFRERRRKEGECSTGGCQRKAHPYRKCDICRRREVTQKRSKRGEVAEELQELDLLRAKVHILEDRNARLEHRNAWLEAMLKVFNKYHVLTEQVENMPGSLEDPYEDDIVVRLEYLLEDE